MATKIRTLVLLAGIALNGPLFASESCERCSELDMFKLGAKAVKKGAWNKPHPAVYVTNFSDNIVIKVAYGHNVDQNFNWETDIFESWGIKVPVEQFPRDYVSAMHAALPGRPVNIGLASSFSLSRHASAGMATTDSGDRPTSIYDSIASPSYDSFISNAINVTAAGVRQTYVDWLNVYNPIPSFSVRDSAPPVYVTFDDGSYAFYKWDQSTQAWKRIKGSAKDSFGNPVPESLSDVAGETGYRIYNFGSGGSEALAQFAYHLNQMNVSIGSAGGSGTRTRIACTSAGSGAPVCEIMQY